MRKTKPFIETLARRRSQSVNRYNAAESHATVRRSAPLKGFSERQRRALVIIGSNFNTVGRGVVYRTRRFVVVSY